MKVVSWNLLRLTGAAVEDVVLLIEREKPDLLLMQEATQDMERLPVLAGGHFHWEPLPSRIHGLAAWSPHPLPPPVVPAPPVTPPLEPSESTWLVGARLSWNLTDILAADDRAQAASARGAAVSQDRAALLDRIHVEVVAALRALEDAEVALRTTRRSLESAEESYRVRRLLFQNARATSVELLDAETDLTRVRLELLNALVDARIARARVDYAVGRALPPQ